MDPDPYIGTTFYFNAKPQIEDAPRGGNGSQVLPVAELSDDFSGDPEDGMEYLFLVRREAATHARVYRASLNPYATVQQQERRVIPERVHSSRPSQEWRNAFIEKFKQTRMRMATPPPASSLPHIDSTAIPAPRQESSWRIFINGKRSKPVKPPAAAAAVPPPALATLKPPSQSITSPKPTGEDSEMTDLESAKAAILASLELDTPDEPTHSSPPPVPSVLSRPSPSIPPPPPTPTPAQIPEFDKLPQLPTPSLILSIPLTSIIHILSHFNEWFTERLETYDQELNWVSSTIFAPPAVRRKPGIAKVVSSGSVKEKGQEKKKNAVAPLPTPHEIHWILSLLSRLNDLLDGDDLSNLRLLAKTLVEMVEASEKALLRAKGEIKKKKKERTMDERREGDEEDEARARCWMVIAAIAGVWKQEDLWNVNL